MNQRGRALRPVREAPQVDINTVFGKTLQTTTQWLSQLQELSGVERPHDTYMLLRAVLHAVRDRLTPAEAVDLGAQLPMLVRGFYYEGWNPADKPLRYRHLDEFLQQVGKEAPWLDEARIEGAVTAVFELLSSRIGLDGEAAEVRKSLPAELRELWPLPGL